MEKTNTKQANTYRVYDSMGRETEFTVTASNKSEACKIIKEKIYSKEFKITSQYYQVKRSYNGGVMGSRPY